MLLISFVDLILGHADLAVFQYILFIIIAYPIKVRQKNSLKRVDIMMLMFKSDLSLLYCSQVSH